MRIVKGIVGAAYILCVAAQVSAATYTVSEVMSGLVTPRGLAFGPDGGLYVAEAGSGGSGPSVVLGNGNTALLGATSSVSRLLGGVQSRILSGLPSVATTAGLDAGGLQDIVFDGGGQAFGLFSFGSDSLQRDANLGAAGAGLGTIAQLPLGGSGSLVHVADVAAHESALNPAGGAIDSNPFGMAITPSGSFLIADAGANDFLRATGAGVVSTLGVLPAKPNPLPFGPPVYQSVPTSIAIGPDGAYYVGQLTGFPFPPGAANVYRFDPSTSLVTEAFTGFTNIIDLTFDDAGMLYVLQVSSNGLASAMGPGTGRLLQINPTTGERTTIASTGLVFPGAVVAGPDGALYVTNRSNAPSGGQVLRIAAVPEPASLALLALGLPLFPWRRFRPSSGIETYQRRLRIEPLEERRMMTTFMVENLNDAGAGSLRQAVLDANDADGPDTIAFAAVSGTIALTSGEIEITEAVTIDGPGAAALTIDAQQNSRILNITALTGDVTLNRLTFTGGRTTGENATFYESTFNGGAIRSLITGNLTIANCAIHGNSTAGYAAAGGGVYASGNVLLTGTTLSGNHTTGYSALGGGLYTYGNVTLTNSVVSGNSTAGKYASGGGIANYGDVTITDSTVSANHTLGEAANGGGVNSTGHVILNHSAVTANHTEGVNGSGGGIGSYGDVTLVNSAVSGNHTQGLTAVGGGIFNFGDVVLTASTVSGNHTEGEGASGGGIRANSNISLLNSTVSGNYTTGYGATGGGLWAYHNVTLTNATISGNHTSGNYAWGGGSFSYDNLTLTSSTISGNHTAGVFAGGAGAMIGQYGALTMSNSILAGNTAVADRKDLWMIGAIVPELHYSLVGVNFGSLLWPAPLGAPDSNGNLIGTAESPIDPKLGPLSVQGKQLLPAGYTIQTQTPLPGSPAINAGNPTAVAGVGGIPLFDQRDAPWSRVVGGRIDIGAIESQPNPLTGDYNFNGAVDAADYSVWRDLLGSTTDRRADGDGNGTVGIEDFGIWTSHFGEKLPGSGAGSGTVAIAPSESTSIIEASVEATSSENSEASVFPKPAEARGAAFAILDTQYGRQRPESHPRRHINHFGTATSDGRDLLALLASDRVGRPRRIDVAAEIDVAGNAEIMHPCDGPELEDIELPMLELSGRTRSHPLISW